MALTFEHDTAAHQYRLLRDGEVISIADYRVTGDDLVVFHHTLTTPAERGNGYAAELVGRALDDVRAAGRSVVATCWFVDQYLALHPQYADLRA